MAKAGRRSGESISRVAERLGLIPPGETVLGHAEGMSAGYRNSVQLYDVEPTTLALTPGHLLFLSDRHVGSVDLAALYDIELLPGGDRGYGISITAVRDRDPGIATWTFTTAAQADILVALERAAARRRAEVPELTRLYLSWGDEVRRRDTATAEILETLREQDTDPLAKATALPVLVRTLAFQVGHARHEPMYEVDGSLVALRDGRLMVTVDDGEFAPIALFRNTDVTFLMLPAPSPHPAPPGGIWEIGYRSLTGERRVIFRAPGPALYGGVPESADAVLHASRLLSPAIATRSGVTWQLR